MKVLKGIMDLAMGLREVRSRLELGWECKEVLDLTAGEQFRFCGAGEKKKIPKECQKAVGSVAANEQVSNTPFSSRPFSDDTLVCGTTHASKDC